MTNSSLQADQENIKKMQQAAEQACVLMKTLSHPDRLMVLCQLKEGEKSVGEIAKMVGIAQSPLSQHLSKMRLQGIVKNRRSAQSIFYSLANEEVERIIDLLYSMYCSDLDHCE
ncbi:MAG: metalloregulator ArsR/SmtB family transcription factor [Xanthomonadales bacterium]|nr:metalloregulator ArsR/SmtB family transcription factor [Xanthomonadales bacterium]